MDTLKRSRASWTMIDQLKADHIRQTLNRQHAEQEKRKALLAGLTEIAHMAEVRAHGLGTLTRQEAFRQLGQIARDAIAAAGDIV
jgi:hypothetical protein